MISEQLRATLLSLKQISDRLKLLNTTSVTKSEALAYKNEIIAALGDIDFTEILNKINEVILDVSDVKSDVQDVKEAIENIDFSELAKQGTDSTATNTKILQEINNLSLSASVNNNNLNISL